MVGHEEMEDWADPVPPTADEVAAFMAAADEFYSAVKEVRMVNPLTGLVEVFYELVPRS